MSSSTPSSSNALVPATRSLVPAGATSIPANSPAPSTASPQSSTPNSGSSSSSTPAQNAQQNSGSSTNSNNNSGGDGTRTRNNISPNQRADYRSFKGSTPEIGATLSLPNERVDSDKGFEYFRKCMENYVLKHLKNARDVLPLITDFVDPTTDFVTNNMPTALFTPQEIAADSMKKAINDQLAKDFATRIGNVENNSTTIFGLVYGQLTTGLIAELESETDYESHAADYDSLWLLKMAKIKSAGVSSRGNPYRNLHDVLINFFTNVRQGTNETEENWYRRFKSECDTLIAADMDFIFYCASAAGHDPISNPSGDEIEMAIEACKSMFFLQFSNMRRYPSLMKFLTDSELVKDDKYPTTLVGVYEMLLEYRKKERNAARNSNNNNNNTDTDSSNPPTASNSRRHRGRGRNLRVSFAQHRSLPEPDRQNPVPGNNGRVVERQCYRCYAWGHTSPFCPATDQSGSQGAQALQIGFNLTQMTTKLIPPSWFLLDTCSTDSVVCNLDFVTHIRPCTPDEVLELNTNGGKRLFAYMARLKLFPMDVHVNEDSMANVLSLKDVRKIDDVKLFLGDGFISVTLPTGLCISFNEHPAGLYFYDTTDPATHVSYVSDTDTIPALTDDNGNVDSDSSVSTVSPQQHVTVNTVDANRQNYTRRQVAQADSARKLQALLAYPSTDDLKRIVATNAIKNCPVTVEDIERGEHIYGPPLPILQGKMTRARPVSRSIPPNMPPPTQLIDNNSNVNLYCDFFFVNGSPFLHTLGDPPQLRSIQAVKSRSGKEIKAGILHVMRMYERRGFTIAHLHGDNEFDLKDLTAVITPTQIHIYAAGEHVATIERSIRTIKERCRCISHSMPFTRHTKLMTAKMLELVVDRLNKIPHLNGMSDTISPSTIVLGAGSIDMQYKTVQFGTYVLLYTETTNTMSRRSVPCIALNPTNEYGGHNFMSLHTGAKLHGYHWVELPMDSWAISRVEALAKKEGKKKMIDKIPIFEWSPGNQISEPNEPVFQEQAPTDNENNIDEVPESDEESMLEDDDSDSDDSDNNDDDEIDVLEQQNDDESYAESHDDTDSYMGRELQETLVEDVMPGDEDDGVSVDSTEDDTSSQATIEAKDEKTNDIIDKDTQDVSKDTPSPRRSNRSNKGIGESRLVMKFGGKTYNKSRAVQFLQEARSVWPTFGKLRNEGYLKSEERREKHIQLLQLQSQLYAPPEISDHMRIAMNVMFTQMSAKQGFKEVGEKAVAAMFKEYKQLNDGPMPGKPVVGPIDIDKVPWEVRKKTMEAVNLIKLKRCGTTKGRTCANGSTQRKYLSKDDSVASPTTSLEALLATFVIDAHEKRDVATFDVPGAYLHAEFPDDKMVLMRLRNEFVDIMCEVNPDFKKYVRFEKGKKVLYVQCLRAIYGCIESALLWYNLFSKTLVDMGFEINPYDKCVANKMINGKQMTIVWYVDDCKVSHVDAAEVTKVLNAIGDHFGKLTITRGNDHTYLGINFHIRDGKIHMEMKDYILDAFKTFGEAITQEAVTPAKPYLFDTREGAKLLPENKADIFHSVTAKLLYLMKRVRPDIEPSIAFLSTRVSCSTEDDWLKLTRVLQFLKKTINDERIIGADGLSDFYTWIDAAYGVHPNMRGHTGGCMSLGWGTIHAKSNKQKLNTKSSTESEIVGVSEYFPYNIWFINFLEAQGFKIKTNILYQDNQSAIKMEKNGRNSCTGNSRHINIRYFFIKDRVDKKEVSIEYCPTDSMLADFFTKPLQGAKFYKFRDVLMGYKHINTLYESQAPKERVENTIENKEDKNVSSRMNINRSYADVIKSSLPFTTRKE